MKPDELYSEYGWCLHGRSYPKFGPFNQAISECVADTSGRHQAQFNTLLTRKFPVFKSAAPEPSIVRREEYSVEPRGGVERVAGDLVVGGLHAGAPVGVVVDQDGILSVRVAVVVAGGGSCPE